MNSGGLFSRKDDTQGEESHEDVTSSEDATSEEVDSLTTPLEDVVEDEHSSDTLEESSADADSEKEVDYEDLHLRLQAEFVNYKRREAEDRAVSAQYAAGRAAEVILPGLDHLQLAISHYPEGTDSNWVVGLEASVKSMLDGLEQLGLVKMEGLEGAAFDPEKAEVLSCEAGDKDVVLRVVTDGYMIHDKVLRLAKVIVGDGTEPKSE